ncbi:hypothetical protein SKTS_13850 [Sulfurimicrobium lacus]|uniref:Uncharacterized protein n=1 Tax=Sulfurimicrobium lacus TaxID=2715678 RepID=A0A6F8VCN3_9PROT|nr:hypothetical protein [Sulfurimicrobium lacus]BCB26499.1 hypothetical protein SKTS_13850 [Sulfurimicrobium lacus]
MPPGGDGGVAEIAPAGGFQLGLGRAGLVACRAQLRVLQRVAQQVGQFAGLRRQAAQDSQQRGGEYQAFQMKFLEEGRTA